MSLYSGTPISKSWAISLVYAGDQVTIEFHGDLAGVLNLAHNPETRGNRRILLMLAVEGLELLISGL